jgi:lipopolysaccharide biosynthesis protein
MTVLNKVIRRVNLLRYVPNNFLSHLLSMTTLGYLRNKSSKVLIIVHAHWAEELIYIIKRINSLKIDVDLILTTTLNEYQEKLRNLEKLSSNHNVKIFIVENSGRDVLPFLHVVKGFDLSAYTLVIKLHTKRSQEIWFRTLIDFHLKSTKRVEKQIRIANIDPLSLIGHPLLSYPVHYIHQQYLKRGVENFLGPLDTREMRGAAFTAGTMFSFHPSYFENISEKLERIGVKDFPVELNYSEYTMAHILERVFGANAYAQGAKIHSIYLRDFLNIKAVFIRIN